MKVRTFSSRFGRLYPPSRNRFRVTSTPVCSLFALCWDARMAYSWSEIATCATATDNIVVSVSSEVSVSSGLKQVETTCQAPVGVPTDPLPRIL